MIWVFTGVMWAKIVNIIYFKVKSTVFCARQMQEFKIIKMIIIIITTTTTTTTIIIIKLAFSNLMFHSSNNDV